LSILAGIKKGRIKRPKYILVYGVDGVGKTSLAADAPDVIFLAAEKGTDAFDINRYQPKDWADVIKFLRALADEPHDFKALAIDSIDWLEPLLWKAIADAHGKESIDDVPYGKGYMYAMDQHRALEALLQKIRARGLDVIILGHAKIEKFSDPKNMQQPYDRYTLKLHKAASDFWREAVDAVLFADYQVLTKEDDKAKKLAVMDEERRVLHTQRKAGFDAKNRYGLPAKITLAKSRPWSSLIADIEKAEGDDSAALIQKIREGIATLHDSQLAEKAEASLVKAGQDSRALTAIFERVIELNVKQNHS
jgi:hypothetical protein